MSPLRPISKSLALTFSLTLLAVTAARPAHAARDITAKVSTAGLDFIAKELPAVLPTSQSFSSMFYKIAGCWTGGDSTLSVPATSVKFTVKSVGLNPMTGRLEVEAEVTGVSGKATATVSRVPVVCCCGFSCTANLAMSKGHVKASFSPRISGSRIDLQNPTIDATVNASDVDITFSDCGVLGSAANTLLNQTVFPQIKQWAIDQLVKVLERLALNYLPPEVEDALSAFTSYTGNLQGFRVTGSLKSVSCATSGVQVGADGSLTVTDSSSCQLPPAPSVPSTSGSPSFSFSGEHLGVAASKTMITEAMLAAWESGMLCLPQGELERLGFPPTMVAAAAILFGMQSASSMDINAPQAPQIHLIPGKDARLKVEAPGFTVVIDGQGPNGPTTITIQMTVTIDAVLSIDPVTRAVIIESIVASTSQTKVSATDSTGLNLAPSVVDTLVKTLVLPMIEEKVTGTELLPHVMHKNGGVLDPYYLYLVRAETTSSFVTLYARLFARPKYDSIRPSTTIVDKPGPLVTQQMFQFVASGSDNVTPDDLLRFQWRVNGGTWSPADYARDHLVALKDGAYVVEARAMDLHGNRDLSPAKVAFEVDGVQPTITVTSAPSGTINQGPAVVSFTVNDDRTAPGAIGVSVKVTHQDTSGGVKVFRDDPFFPGLSDVTISNLAKGSYTVELAAKDEAGNQSPTEVVTFGFQAPVQPPPSPDGGIGPAPDGGGTVPVQPTDPSNPGGSGCSCALAGGAPDRGGAPALALVLLLGLGLLWSRRRR